MYRPLKQALNTLREQSQWLGSSNLLGEALRAQAQRGVSAHPENTLYTQLAQSLVNWCALIEKTPNGDKPYARATMALLCRELRRALANQ